MKTFKVKEIGFGSIVFDNGYYLVSEHHQDCCETVYADFNYIKDYNALGETKDKTIFEVEFTIESIFDIEEVEGEGIKIRTACRSPIFIPCYDIQNGYYSSNLHLELLDSKNKLIKKSDELGHCTNFREC